MINLNKPKLSSSTPNGQIEELRRYIFALIDDLQYALGNQEKQLNELRVEIESLSQKIQQEGKE